MREALSSAEPSFWRLSGPSIFATLLLFAAFYAAALLLRRKVADHRRLIIVASSAGVGAAVFRLFAVIFGQMMWVAPASILATNLFIVAGLTLDLLRERRIHRAYVIGLPICIGVELAVYLTTPTPAGQIVAQASRGSVTPLVSCISIPLGIDCLIGDTVGGREVGLRRLG